MEMALSQLPELRAAEISHFQCTLPLRQQLVNHTVDKTQYAILKKSSRLGDVVS